MIKSKVMLCGDSISKGIIYDNIANKYKKCEKAFAGILDKIFNTKIINISKFGNTVTMAEKRFHKSFKETEPDVVIFALGGNDCDFNWNEVSENPDGVHVPKTEIKQFSTMLKKMTISVLEEGKRPVLMNLPPLNPDAYFNWISRNDETMKKNILKWMGSISMIYWWQERYNCAVQDIARRQKIELIDIRNEFLKKSDFRNCICVDGIHPNAKGQQLIANAIEKHFKATLSA